MFADFDGLIAFLHVDPSAVSVIFLVKADHVVHHNRSVVCNNISPITTKMSRHFMKVGKGGGEVRSENENACHVNKKYMVYRGINFIQE